MQKKLRSAVHPQEVCEQAIKLMDELHFTAKQVGQKLNVPYKTIQAWKTKHHAALPQEQLADITETEKEVRRLQRLHRELAPMKQRKEQRQEKVLKHFNDKTISGFTQSSDCKTATLFFCPVNVIVGNFRITFACSPFFMVFFGYSTTLICEPQPGETFFIVMGFFPVTEKTNS
ncbi:hypothetical protein FACS189427_11840 [Planctomycetales bacterium]|nr:hypothetical protein FACS189427_11840 [Planctomycetales bacterium]